MKLNIIYFSKDRPMQLDLALRTNFECLGHVKAEVHWSVLYKASNQDYKKAYFQVSKENNYAAFIEEYGFQQDVLAFAAWGDYTMFVVDDTVFTKPYSFTKINSILRNNDEAIGFSLRLGKNTTYCYPLDINNEIPDFKPSVYSDVSYVNWNNVSYGDFGYPLELSSSVYRTSMIVPVLYSTLYYNPNELEWEMDRHKELYKTQYRLYFFEKSVAFSNPLNKVQEINRNRFSENKVYDPINMLQLYNRGYRIKNTFNGFISNACHQEVDPVFYLKENVT